MKFGFIAHHSPTYPTIILDLLDGLTVSLGDISIDKKLLKKDTTIEIIEQETQSMFIMGSDCIIVYSNFNNLLAVSSIAEKLNKHCILIDSGTLITSAISLTPKSNSYWLSMQMAECNYALANQIDSKKEENVAVVSDFLNSGYHLEYFFIKDFSNAEVQMRFISQLDLLTQDELLNIEKDIILNNISLVFINAHSAIGKQFLTLANSETLINKLPNLKFVIVDQLLQDISPEIIDKKNISTCTTWHSRKDSTDQILNEIYKISKRELNIFSILGYEAGIIAQQIEKDEFKEFESPRGTIKFNKENSFFKAPLYIINANEITQIEEKIQIELEKKMFENNIESSGGWNNPYMCY